MKRLYFRYLPLLFLLHGLPSAQNIQVCTSSNVGVSDDDPASNFPLTNFGTLLTGENRTRTFVIRNTDPVTTLTITSISVGDTTNFGVDLTFTATSVPPDTQTSFDISFHPMSAGSHGSQITIESDDPDSESVYKFGVAGTGQAEGPLPVAPNLDVRLSKPAKFKLNKTTGLVDMKMKVDVLNTGTSESLAPTITLIGAENEVLRFVGKSNAVLVESFAVKPLPAAVGTKVKKKKVNIKLSGLPNTDTFFWILANNSVGTDADFADNVTIDGFLAITP